MSQSVQKLIVMASVSHIHLPIPEMLILSIVLRKVLERHVRAPVDTVYRLSRLVERVVEEWPRINHLHLTF